MGESLGVYRNGEGGHISEPKLYDAYCRRLFSVLIYASRVTVTKVNFGRRDQLDIYRLNIVISLPIDRGASAELPSNYK